MRIIVAVMMMMIVMVVVMVVVVVVVVVDIDVDFIYMYKMVKICIKWTSLTETVSQALAMLVLRVLRQRGRLRRAHELGAADLADYRH